MTLKYGYTYLEKLRLGDTFLQSPSVRKKCTFALDLNHNKMCQAIILFPYYGTFGINWVM